MKILLVGLGSIGKRHLRNILSLGYTDIVIVSRAATLPEEFQTLLVYPSIRTAIDASRFDAAIICTPTSQHIDDLQQLLAANITNIYLEKPISNSLDKITSVINLIESPANNIIVGYDLHFDPGLQKVKELLAQEVIGKVASVNAQVGQFLPDWRPQEDYRQGMSAKIETGGGVMLDLVHEFDYLTWLLGKVNLVAGLNRNSGALEIETEDVAEVLLQFESGCIGTIHLDYLQRKLVRNCIITGHKGSISWNLAESEVSWIDENKSLQHFSYKSFERNDRFVSIMKAFLTGEKDSRLTSFAEGLESLKLVVAAKKSSETKKFVSLSTLNLLPE